MDKIICVGKNYMDHAKELGDAVPEKPVLFLKPPSTLHWISSGATLPIFFQDRMDHELEIVMRVRYRTPLELKSIEAQNPSDASFPWYFDSFALGIDWTRRDLQAELKKKGQPWEIAKAFRGSIFVGPMQPLSDWQGDADEKYQNFDNNKKLNFELKINGVSKQKGDSTQMRMSPLELLKMITETFDLCDGDLVFTGTPAGVGPVKSGDQLEMSWWTDQQKSKPLNFSVALQASSSIEV